MQNHTDKSQIKLVQIRNFILSSEHTSHWMRLKKVHTELASALGERVVNTMRGGGGGGGG